MNGLSSVGACCLQAGVWQFKSSWEDRIIGGRLSIKGRSVTEVLRWGMLSQEEKRQADAGSGQRGMATI